MRYADLIAISTYKALSELGGEFSKQAETMSETQLLRLGRMIQKNRLRGNTQSLLQMITNAKVRS